MAYPTNPHLGLPFRVEGNAFAVTEQDTADEVADCVELALRTVQGERRTLSSFGRPDHLEFISDRDLAQAEIEQTIEDAEPRARGYVERDDSQADQGILRLKAMWAWTQQGGDVT
jgi:hypothetical protein